MARLVVNPGSSTAWEIPLKPGVNSLGRGVVNDFKLTEPSISSSHCQIVIDPSGASIKDLGSTNGTFLNHVPIQEAGLESGQTIHLGSLEMMFFADDPASPAAAVAPSASSPPIPVPIARTTLAAPRYGVAASAPPVPTAALRPTPPQAVPISSPATGNQGCKHHPKSPGRYFCSQCQGYFCELCVTTRSLGGVPHKFCRHCGCRVLVASIPVMKLEQP